MSEAPIDRCDAVPVPGKPFCFRLVDKVTGEPFDINAKINQAFEAGNFRDEKYMEDAGVGSPSGLLNRSD